MPQFKLGDIVLNLKKGKVGRVPHITAGLCSSWVRLAYGGKGNWGYVREQEALLLPPNATKVQIQALKDLYG